jgi:DNA repair photolyase
MVTSVGESELTLFGEPEPATSFPLSIGRTRVEDRPSNSILTRASGFMSDFDYTLNPYSGCSFGCTYCYAAFFSRDDELQRTWGEWVHAKTNALQTLRRMRTDLRGKTVYMSSVTDPYQSVERRLELVRELLPELARRGARLVVQTRSPLVTRDIDLFGEFDAIRVNMTVTTDDDDVQRAFEPHCPTNRKRLDAIATVAAAGIDCRITLTPLLPIVDPVRFADQLLQTGVKHFVVQPFHATKGRFVAGTREQALSIVDQLNWSDDSYRKVVEILREKLPHLDEGRDGFQPV